jgi:type 2 lantibiotic biosynthesis protein LanM
MPSIVGQARTLRALDALRAGVAGESALGQGLRKRWVESLAGEANLTKRLSWTEASKDALAGAPSRPSSDNEPSPPWRETLLAVMHAARNPTDGGDASETASISFGRLLEPFVRVAWDRLRDAVETCLAFDGLLGATAAQAARTGLYRQLGDLSSFVLNLEFRAYVRAVEEETGTPLDPRGRGDALYHAFVDAHLRDAFETLFSEYPVLGRLMGTTVDRWVETTAEMLVRAGADAPALGAHFGREGDAMLPIADVFPHLSDPHRGGRTVSGVRFASGLILAYKPKPLQLEEIFFGLVEWMNERQGPPLTLKLPRVKVLAREGYGWSEWVERSACDDESAIARYYRRAGILLALLMVLQSTDVHTENLIAAGEYPVLIDLETVLQPQEKAVRTPKGTDAFAELADLMWDSVLRPGMLPQWTFDRSRENASDLSGLGHSTQDPGYGRAMRWFDVNTDRMRLAPVTDVQGVAERSTVALGETPVDPVAYVPYLVAGFEEGYLFLLSHRDALLETEGPLERFRNQTLRYVIRATEVYAHVQAASLRPRFLRSEIERTIALDILARAYLAQPTMPSIWSFLAEELDAIDSLDVPIFTTSTSETFLRGSETEVAEFFRDSALNSVYRRLRRMSRADLALQKGIIEASFYVRGTAAMETVPDARPRPPVPSERPENATFVERADEIAHTLLQLASRGEDGSLAWLGLGYVPEAQRKQLRPIGGSLYDGDSGIALFFGSLAKVTGDRRWAEAALDALANTRKRIDYLATPGPGFESRHIDIGGATGIASIAYALAKVGDLISDRELLDDAARSIELLEPKLVAADRYFDVISGSAGALLGALTVHQVRPGTGKALEIADRCGRHLLANRVPTGGGHLAWATLDSRCLTGFSHGASGIAYALARLWELTGDPGYRDAVAMAFAYEDALFNVHVSNWPDLRTDEPSYCSTWCHGAAGIFLARALASDCVETPESIARSVAAALERQPPLAVDHLCCGTMGLADILLRTGRSLRRPGYEDRAKELASVVLATAEDEDVYRLHTGRVTLPNPGLFQGLAGVGLSFLRMASTTDVPFVLAWE